MGLIATQLLLCELNESVFCRALCRLRGLLLLFSQPLPSLTSSLLALRTPSHHVAETSMAVLALWSVLVRVSGCCPPLPPPQLHSFIFFQASFSLMVPAVRSSTAVGKIETFSLSQCSTENCDIPVLQRFKRLMSSQLWPESASELFSEGLYIAQLFLKIQLLHPEIWIPLWPNSNYVVVAVVGF